MKEGTPGCLCHDAANLKAKRWRCQSQALGQAQKNARLPGRLQMCWVAYLAVSSVSLAVVSVASAGLASAAFFAATASSNFLMYLSVLA